MRWILPPSNLRFLIVTLLILGVFFRFANLDTKLYWRDETFTSLRIYGYAKQEVSNEIVDGEVITKDFLQRYQRPNPERNLFNIVRNLAAEDPKHPPLYFVLTRLWTQILGHSVAAIRSFSTFISLLVVPAMYWLCLELFGSSVVGWIAVALVAVSPFHVLYAQEARMYALHMLTILLSSAILLGAIRVNTKTSWGLYAGAIALGLYTHSIFSLLVALHGTYMALNKEIRGRKVFASYLKATFLGFLFFAPWLFLILSQLDKVQSTTSWVHEITLSLNDLRTGWEVHFARLFFDINPNYAYENRVADTLWWLVIRALLVLFAYSIYFLVQTSYRKIYSFVLILIFVPALLLAAPDVLFGGIRSIQPRYSTISYLGCYLPLAYLFAQKTQIDHKRWQFLWSLLFVGVISLGIVSCILNVFQLSNKGTNSQNLPISNILNQTSSLLISECNLDSLQNWDGQFGNLISLSYHLNDDVKIQCFNSFDRIDVSKIPDGFDAYFVLDPPPALQTQFKEQPFDLELVHEKNVKLWRLEK